MSMIPHPVVSILVTILWMVLTGFSTGQLVLGVLVGLIAGVSGLASFCLPRRLDVFTGISRRALRRSPGFMSKCGTAFISPLR